MFLGVVLLEHCDTLLAFQTYCLWTDTSDGIFRCSLLFKRDIQSQLFFFFSQHSMLGRCLHLKQDSKTMTSLASLLPKKWKAIMLITFKVLHEYEDTLPDFVIVSNNTPKSHYFLPAHSKHGSLLSFKSQPQKLKMFGLRGTIPKLVSTPWTHFLLYSLKLLECWVV